MNGTLARWPVECDVVAMALDSIVASFVFGLLGTAMCCFGKWAGRAIPMVCGVALIVLPSFVPGVAAMIAVCLIVSAVPFVVTA